MRHWWIRPQPFGWSGWSLRSRFLRCRWRCTGRRGGGSSRDQARILDLRYAEGLPPREIASRLGIEVTVVYEALRTAKDAYRTALLEVLAGHHPGATRPELEKICAELGGLL